MRLRHVAWMISAWMVMAVGVAWGQSPYSDYAGESVPMEMVEVKVVGEDGKERIEKIPQKVKTDGYGNAAGNDYDLAKDNAFDGQTIAVIHLYNGEGFDFSLPKTVLEEKGFVIKRWTSVPDVEELDAVLDEACQLWVISHMSTQLSAEHIERIKAFFDAGHGVYIWGDNDPYYADANALGQALVGTTMTGNVMGDQTVSLQQREGERGIVANHLMSTGLEYVYEGITIATVQPVEGLHPLVYGSANNLVAAYYEKDGKRLIFDGGFTRLYVKWDTAGTGRYVKNAAAWLTNYERFGDSVISEAMREEKRRRLTALGVDPDVKDPRKTEPRRRWGE